VQSRVSVIPATPLPTQPRVQVQGGVVGTRCLRATAARAWQAGTGRPGCGSRRLTGSRLPYRDIVLVPPLYESRLAPSRACTILGKLLLLILLASFLLAKMVSTARKSCHSDAHGSMAVPPRTVRLLHSILEALAHHTLRRAPSLQGSGLLDFPDVAYSNHAQGSGLHHALLIHSRSSDVSRQIRATILPYRAAHSMDAPVRPPSSADSAE
jgi:hypothetical protein